VLPAPTLLHSNSSPLRLGENAVLRQRLCHVFRQNYMAILELCVQILFRVFNLL
jgi:hypothetical protein